MVWAFAEEGWQIYWTKAVEDEVARQEVLVVSNLGKEQEINSPENHRWAHLSKIV